VATKIVDLSEPELTGPAAGAAAGPAGAPHLRRGWLPATIVALGVTLLQPAIAEADAPPPGLAAPAALARADSPALERRMKLLSRELDLTPAQQITVRQILQEQHEAVRRIWSNIQLPPDERTVATRAVTERTADRIRAVLTDEQRKKYNAPRPQSPGGATPQKRVDVQAWLDASRDKQAGGLPQSEHFDRGRVDWAGR
jgi:periplasmic protein CpxP/Spy